MGRERGHTIEEREELRRMAARLAELASIHSDAGCDEDQYDNACYSGWTAGTLFAAAILIRSEVGEAEKEAGR